MSIIVNNVFLSVPLPNGNFLNYEWKPNYWAMHLNINDNTYIHQVPTKGQLDGLSGVRRHLVSIRDTLDRVIHHMESGNYDTVKRLVVSCGFVDAMVADYRVMLYPFPDRGTDRVDVMGIDPYVVSYLHDTERWASDANLCTTLLGFVNTAISKLDHYRNVPMEDITYVTSITSN